MRINIQMMNYQKYYYPACLLLWQQGNIMGSTYFTCDKVVDFTKCGHNYNFEVYKKSNFLIKNFKLCT